MSNDGTKNSGFDKRIDFGLVVQNKFNFFLKQIKIILKTLMH